MKPQSRAQSVTEFIFSIVKAYKGYVAVFMLSALLWAAVNTLLPYIIKIIIDRATEFQGDKWSAFKEIQPAINLYIGLWVGLCCLFRLMDWARLRLFPSLRQDTMDKMFVYLNQHSHQYFQNNFAGSLINKIVDMQSGIVEVLTILDEAFWQFLGITVALFTLLLVHPLFALILLAWVMSFLAITFVFLKPIEQLSHMFAQARSSLVGKMVDSIGNILNVRLFARQTFENNYIHKEIVDTVQKDRNVQWKVIYMRIFWDITIILLLAANLWMLGYLYGQGKVTIGDFSFVIYISISILWNFWFIADQFVYFSEELGKCRQALAIMNAPHDIVDTPDAKPLTVSKGEITFQNVSFHYDNGNSLFQNKNIQIHAGEKLGLVGFSGSGKSTFVNLILRLFEVKSGQIKIDGQNICKVTQNSLRSNIALIPQDISLFHRTLMENIRYGRIEASDEEVMAVAEQAHCHEFISVLPEGYQSMVGERGIKLSGGQRQRIAIARAMLKNAPILILDEATSSLDSVTEKYIQDAMQQIMQNKTTIVIAHRLSTLAAMDRILVFDKGKIIEDGTHEELIQQQRHYAKMWAMQASGFLPQEDSE